MKQIYLNFLTQKKDSKRISYEDLVASTNMSKSKLQRIFTGQVDVTIDDLEVIVEKGLKEKLRDLYAIMGEQEFRESADNDFKGTQALVDEFMAEKEQIKQEYEARLTEAEQHRIETQNAFDAALKTMQTQYAKNAEYLTSLVQRSESYNRQLTERAVKAEEAAAEANKRADKYAADRDAIDKRRHQVFWSMLVVVFVLLGIVIASFILNIPGIGWGNLL